MRILITGATGFVGRHLIDYLQKSSRATGLEIFGTCYPERPERCLDLCAAQPTLRLVHADLRSEGTITDLVKSVRPDRVFHLAAISQVRLSWEKRRETLETNLMGTFHLFEAIRCHAPQAKVLFISSSDVYGDLKPGKKPKVYREDERSGVVSPYSFTKVAAELLSELYGQREKLGIVVARPFPHTGPGQSADFVCSDWARQIALIEKDRIPPVIKVGNLKPRRDYSDVRDIVRAYDLLLKKGSPGEVYNVCSGKAPSLKDILQTLLSFSSRKIGIEVDPAKLRKADISFLAGDPRKILKKTGWKPRIPLETTLNDLLSSWREKFKRNGDADQA